MPRTHNMFPPDFRAEAVRLVLPGAAVSRVSEDLDISDQTIRNWVNQHQVNQARRDA